MNSAYQSRKRRQSGDGVRFKSVETNSTLEETMEAIGLLVTLEARLGKDAEAEAFLKVSELFAVSPQVEKVEVLANTPLKG
jgi:hypothetical protein